MPLPEPRLILIADAARLVAQRCRVSETEARDALVVAFREGTLRVCGLDQNGARNEFNDYVFRKGRIDWEGSGLHVGPDETRLRHRYDGVSIDRRDLDDWIGPAAPSGRLPRRRGPPFKYDWEEFEARVAQIVGHDPDGFPLQQAILERQMADWCAKKWGPDNVPAESTIREHISRHHKQDMPGR